MADRLTQSLLASCLPWRWHPLWCKLGQHNPVYSLSQSLAERRPVWICWWCEKRLRHG